MIEEEPFSLAALQWSLAAIASRVPYSVQVAETRDRRLPAVVRHCRRLVLEHAALVMARSPSAWDRATAWGAGAGVRLIPHPVPAWSPVDKAEDRPFTVGFAGRLVEEKGLWDLVSAVEGHPEWRLLVVGNGPLRDALGAASPTIEIRCDVDHREMPQAFALMDVLVLPSRSVANWSEQFGRVLVEALWCLTPVIGSSSGEIPWIIGTCGGGWLFEEGDVTGLRLLLEHAVARPEECAAVATHGRRVVEESFSLAAVARQVRDEVVRFTG